MPSLKHLVDPNWVLAMNLDNFLQHVGTRVGPLDYLKVFEED